MHRIKYGRNTEMTSFVWRETMLTHLLLWGNSYCQIIRSGRAKIIGLYPLLPDRMEVDRDKSGTLGQKKYTVDFVTGRALRELEPAARMYNRILTISNAAVKGETIPDEDQLTIPEAMDEMIRWFCILFQNQFTPDDVLDNYPVDRLMHDLALAIMAVQTQTTSVLDAFPTKAVQETEPPMETETTT